MSSYNKWHKSIESVRIRCLSYGWRIAMDFPQEPCKLSLDAIGTTFLRCKMHIELALSWCESSCCCGDLNEKYSATLDSNYGNLHLGNGLAWRWLIFATGNTSYINYTLAGYHAKQPASWTGKHALATTRFYVVAASMCPRWDRWQSGRCGVVCLCLCLWVCVFTSSNK